MEVGRGLFGLEKLGDITGAVYTLISALYNVLAQPVLDAGAQSNVPFALRKMKLKSI